MRMRRGWQLLVTLVALSVVVATVEVVVHFSDGDFSGGYSLTGSFSQAGTGLQPDAEVVYRGVQVGRVSSISLHDRRARVAMLMDPGFRVPTDAVATIEPINVFGADQVALSFPSGQAGPALPPGATLAHTTVEPGLDSLFAAAAPLLNRVDTTDLSTVIATLAQATDGEGPTIRASIDEGAQLAAFLDETLPAQITALDSTAGFASAIAPTASSIDAVGTAANGFLPIFNENSAGYAKLLSTVTPFADNLAQFLSAYHPTIETLLDQGDDVARLLLTDQDDIGTLIAGLAIYEGKIGSSVDPAEVLPDGTIFAYFDAFLTLGDIDQLVCSLLDPSDLPSSLSSALAPLQQALTGAGTPLQCGTSSTAGGGLPGVSSLTGSTPTTGQAAQNLANQLYGAAAAPEPTGLPAGSPSAPASGGSSASGGSTGSGGATGSGGSSGSTGSSGSGVLQQLLGGLL